ncbi:hypothetical protein B0H13DRAFT_1879680 [Mycena leptocephala]|nr:hypothetical protein B0H13DRAFT_1879680 [Mycena leptocephala]
MPTKATKSKSYPTKPQAVPLFVVFLYRKSQVGILVLVPRQPFIPSTHPFIPWNTHDYLVCPGIGIGIGIGLAHTPSSPAVAVRPPWVTSPQFLVSVSRPVPVPILAPIPISVLVPVPVNSESQTDGYGNGNGNGADSRIPGSLDPSLSRSGSRHQRAYPGLGPDLEPDWTGAEMDSPGLGSPDARGPT